MRDSRRFWSYEGGKGAKCEIVVAFGSVESRNARLSLLFGVTLVTF